MKVKNIVIAMLVSVPSFVASSVVATATPYDHDAQAQAMAAAAAEGLRNPDEDPTIIYSLAESNDNSGGGPICQPWPYCY